MTRFTGLPMLMIVSTGLCGCIDRLHSQLRSQSPPAKWTTGFWYWNSNSAEAASAKQEPDVVFFHAGTIRKYAGRNGPAQWFVSGEIPGFLPPAREYWVVFRDEEAGVPDTSAATALAARVSQLLADARERKLKVVGVQLDIDSPTGELPRYANFLRAVRKELPAGLQISVTALLDWFRDGTSIADLIRETDEFVPQFYDVVSPIGAGASRAIAVNIDAGRWAPKFNGFGKRYRIGISTFGRARLARREEPYQRLIGDLTPSDIGGNPAFGLQASRNEAKEVVLDYRATRKALIGYNGFEPGDMVQFILSTPEAIRADVEGAKLMRGNCAGVVFFRWPAANENLVMKPDETLMAAGLAPAEKKVAAVDAVDGHCAAVSCVDLYLVNAGALSSRPLRYRIHSSVELEYFLPEDRVPVRMADPSDLEITLPAYGGLSRMLLGRAVTAAHAEFRVEGKQ